MKKIAWILLQDYATLDPRCAGTKGMMRMVIVITKGRGLKASCDVSQTGWITEVNL
jgi:hypothetical protein